MILSTGKSSVWTFDRGIASKLFVLDEFWLNFLPDTESDCYFFINEKVDVILLLMCVEVGSVEVVVVIVPVVVSEPLKNKG